MDNFDFQFCEFIDYNMSYLTYADFCNKCALIKKMFQELNYYQKRFYKWYVYANINMGMNYKNTIWQYLNFDYKEYYLNLLHLITKKK